ncbi:MAG: hypothetical protein ACJ8AI_27910, partial [Rhodopila sp.]
SVLKNAMSQQRTTLQVSRPTTNAGGAPPPRFDTERAERSAEGAEAGSLRSVVAIVLHPLCLLRQQRDHPPRDCAAKTMLYCNNKAGHFAPALIIMRHV